MNARHLVALVLVVSAALSGCNSKASEAPGSAAPPPAASARVPTDELAKPAEVPASAANADAKLIDDLEQELAADLVAEDG